MQNPQHSTHEPNHAKRLKTDAVSAASRGGGSEPGNLQNGDAVSAASSNAGSMGFDLALGRFVFEGVTYTFGQVRGICKGLKVLYYFSGPRRAPATLRRFACNLAVPLDMKILGLKGSYDSPIPSR